MDAMKKQLILLFCSTALLLASPFIDCRILALTGIIFAAVMYFVFNIRYFSIGTAVLSLLYGFSIIPVSAFAGPLVMVLFGEVLRMLFYKTGHSLAVFGAGSAAALIFAMVYTLPQRSGRYRRSLPFLQPFLQERCFPQAEALSRQS